MKKYFILLLLIGSCSIAFAQSRKLTLTLKNRPIAELFQQIQSQCGYVIVYSDEVITDSITLSIEVSKMPVTEVLTKVLPEKMLSYHLVAKQLIAIGKKTTPDNKNLQQVALSGTITNTRGIPIPFVSVSLLEGDLLRTGAISEENGKYLLYHSFIPKQRYQIKLSSVGYEPLELDFSYPDTAAVRKISMMDDNRTLQTVTVTTAKPLMERKTDRYIVNVDGSVLGLGKNGLEVLQKSPGIWVNNDGSIKIKGNQSVMVMINDVVQRMSESDLAEYLRTLRSEDISKIEIISSPPAEFEAAGSGGIIHIVLKKNRKDGLVGSLSAQYRQQEKRPYFASGISLNYKIKRFYLSGNLSGGKDESDYLASTKISYPNQDFYSSVTNRYNNNGRFIYRLGATYELSDQQTIGIQTVQTKNKMNQYFDTDIAFLGNNPLTGTANSEWFRKPSLSSTTLNYNLKTDSNGSGIKVIADYVYSTRSELNNFLSQYTLSQKNAHYRNNTPNKTNLFSLQTDYTQEFKRSVSFKTGLKFANTERDNEVKNENFINGTWQLNPNLSNRFIYQENLAMVYASLEKGWGKLSAKIGIRAEHTAMDGNSITGNERFKRGYTDIFPSVFISQKLNEENGNAIYISYAKRLQRPSFSDLNPYRLQFDDYLTQLGNPNLTPEYTHKIEIGSMFWKGFSADIYAAFTHDKIAQLANPVAGNVIEYQTRNFNSSNEYGFSLNAPIKILKWWETNISLAGYNQSYNLNAYRIRQTTFYARSQHQFNFKNIVDVNAAIDYRSPYITANTNIAYQLYTDLGISKRIWDKRMNIMFYISDLFNTAREKDYTEFAATRIDFYQKRPTQTFSLSLSYNFSSGKKFNNKKIEQSNDDEKRRIGN